MARIFAPRIVFQHDTKPSNHSLGLTSRDVVTANQRGLMRDPWYSYYSLVYERSLLDQWCSGYTLPWHSRISGLNGRLNSGVHNRFSAIHRADRRRGATQGKWVRTQKLVLYNVLCSVLKFFRKYMQYLIR